MLYILAIFQSLIQERRNYIPQGWSKFYEFSYSDLKAAQLYVESQDLDTIDWVTMHGIFENALYGGRVDNRQDVKVLRLFIKTFFSQNCID